MYSHFRQSAFDGGTQFSYCILKIMVGPEPKKRMPEKSSLKKAVKWIFCDKVVIFSAIAGVILLLVTLIVFAKRVDLIRYRGIEYAARGTVCRCLLFKMTSPALAVNMLLKSMPVRTIPQHIILYFLMFAVQIVVYMIVGKVASVMLSGRIVAVWICIGIVLLVLAVAYEINPAQESMVETAKGKPFYLFLMITSLPAFFTEQCLLGLFGKTALLYIIVFPVMLVVQILLYGFLGKLLVSMLPGL
jgi:hypothetical protein